MNSFESRNISHRHANENLTRNGYSGLFKVMHLGITESRRRTAHPVYKCVLMSEITHEVTNEMPENCRFCEPHCHSALPL